MQLPLGLDKHLNKKILKDLEIDQHKERNLCMGVGTPYLQGKNDLLSRIGAQSYLGKTD